MAIDLKTPMTFYEFLAIILAAIAIIIPILQWLWKKWITKPKLNHLITGRAFLFINRSGSYMQIEGVYDAQNKPILIRKISLKLIRTKDDKALNLAWSTFVSPINQRFVGNFASTTEMAHPFRIEKDSMVPAFTEFADPLNSSERIFDPFYESLKKEAFKFKNKEYTFDQALAEYSKTSAYDKAQTVLQKELFWEIGKYTATLQVEYDHKTINFIYEFEIDAETSNALSHNVHETLIAPLKDIYQIPYSFKTVRVELRENIDKRRKLNWNKLNLEQFYIWKKVRNLKSKVKK